MVLLHSRRQSAVERYDHERAIRNLARWDYDAVSWRWGAYPPCVDTCGAEAGIQLFRTSGFPLEACWNDEKEKGSTAESEFKRSYVEIDLSERLATATMKTDVPSSYPVRSVSAAPSDRPPSHGSAPHLFLDLPRC